MCRLIKLTRRLDGEVFYLNAEKIVFVEHENEGTTIYHEPYHPHQGELSWTHVQETPDQIRDSCISPATVINLQAEDPFQ